MQNNRWSRLDTVNLVLEIEKKVNLDNYVVDGVKIWPFIRIKLFFYLITCLERTGNISPVSNDNKSYSLINRLKIFKLIASTLFKNSISKKKDYIFIGSKSHRAPLKGLWMNRFFDPLILLSDIKDKSLNIDTDISFNNLHSGNNVLFFPILRKIDNIFKKESQKSNLNVSDFSIIVGTIDKIVKAKLKINHINLQNEFKNKLIKSWTKIYNDSIVWERFFKKVKPKKIFTLCYYSESVLAANIAATRSNIPKIEIQHGPINPLHLSYGSFNNVPNCHDSQLLPDIFLTWDQNSKEALDNSFKDKENIHLGHPWFDYNQHLNQENENEKKIASQVITYALQPSKEMGDPFPPYLLKWIKESNEYTWWFRLHPRQFNEYEKIKLFLEKELVGFNWEIERPTYTPLPDILKQSKYLITLCSGVISEAAFLGIPSIALSDLATEYYKQELDLNMLYVISHDDKKKSWYDLQCKFADKLVAKKLPTNNSFFTFQKILNNKI